MVAYTENQKKKLKQAVADGLARGLSHQKACAAATVPYTVFWRWRHEDPKYRELLDDVRQSRIKNVEDALYRDALKGNTTAQIFWLKNRAHDEWRDRLDQHHTGEVQKIVVQINSEVKRDKQNRLEGVING